MQHVDNVNWQYFFFEKEVLVAKLSASFQMDEQISSLLLKYTSILLTFHFFVNIIYIHVLVYLYLGRVHAYIDIYIYCTYVFILKEVLLHCDS